MTTPNIPSGGHYSSLPPEAQRQILRDFQALAAAIGAAPSVYDAIIDPILPTSDPANHRYKNLTDLLVHETWLTNYAFSVGVHQRQGVAITEPNTTVSIAGMGDLALHGIGGPHTNASPWQFAAISTSLGQNIFLDSLAIQSNAFSPSGVSDQGTVLAHDCEFYNNVNALSGRSSQAWNCLFDHPLAFSSSQGVGVTYTFYDCVCPGFTQTTSLASVLWYGGNITGDVSASNGLTMFANIFGNVTCTNGGSGPTSQIDIINLGFGQGAFTIGAGVIGRIEGSWAGGTWSGTGSKTLKISANNATTDITGPCKIDLNQLDAGFGDHVILRGNGISGSIHSTARFECIGLTNSGIRCYIINGSTHVITFDASSHNNLFLWSGKHEVSEGDVQDLGTSNRVITEDSDSYTDPLIEGLRAGLLYTTGLDGTDGDDGMPGPPGAQGFTGPPGPIGGPGPMGDRGEDGDDGMPGPPGARGFTGLQGVQGVPVDGLDGEDGVDGMPGPQGAQGFPGAQGVSIQGPPGDPGEDGLDGMPGPQGATGATGATGLQGPANVAIDGEDGMDGLPGPQGATGATGATGLQGPANVAIDGEDGMDGLPGPQGATGFTGPQGLSIQGPAGQDGTDGDDGLPGPTGPQGFTGAPGVSIRGLDGLDADEAQDGLPGPQGATGFTGPQGASIQGKPGEDGEDGWDAPANAQLTHQSLNPPGVITMFGGSTIPAGWLLCDGTSYLRATYGALFGAIGTNFGSADGTHFNVPDMRDHFPKGANGDLGTAVASATHIHDGHGTLVTTAAGSATGGVYTSPTVGGAAYTDGTFAAVAVGAQTIPALVESQLGIGADQSGAGYAKLYMQGSGTPQIARQITVAGWTETVRHTWAANATNSGSTGNTVGTDLGGTTSAGFTGTGSVTGAKSVTPSWTVAPTVSAPTISGGSVSAVGFSGSSSDVTGSTSAVTAPNPANVAVNFIIKF